MLNDEQRMEWLKREAAIGFAQLEAGETVQVSSKEEFMQLLRGTAPTNPTEEK